ncbi:helix-turn-helix domain-containing protein [Wenzhouxiangella limi]|uniref:Transcriptional regulator n=1 Tax=Wenzhouxiangella limi TaxID=2707351 RepID=A0A845VA82_9GAMM|nr:transcriptional regulator [Wenzhouxiangella limi]NDY97031.1 transcriptional regulator [Wenzhouxiangella limi]
MDIKPIKSEADYRATLREIEGLMGSKADTPEGDRLDVLVTLVQAYEARHYPMDYPDPVEAIKFRMEQQGLTVDDLVPAIGRSNRVYEVLNGKRSLSVAMIRRLHRQFDIPADVLIREAEDKRNERVESA